jgi:uroporphyrinogen decarboxylase
MTEKERVKDWIRFEGQSPSEAAIVPWQVNYTTELAARVMEELGLREESFTVRGKNIYRYNRLDDYFGNHLAFLRNRAVDSLAEVSPGMYEDEWSVVWDRRIDKDIGTPVNCPLESGRIEDLKPPDPDDPARFAHFDPLIEANGQRYLLVKFSYSLFERAWALRGMENLLVDFVQNRGFAEDLLDAICEYNLALIKNLTAYPIDGIYFGDDWGSQRGLLMSPDMWRSCVRPRLKRMYDLAHTQGYDVFIHSCGDISAVLNDLVGIGLNVFNPFQPEVMDVRSVMAEYTGRLAFYGSLSIQKTLPFGSREEVAEEVENRLSLARRYGGLIVSPSHDMPPDIGLDNIRVMSDTLKGQ